MGILEGLGEIATLIGNIAERDNERKDKIRKEEASRFARLKEGDTFKMGKYNSKDIEWMILEKDTDSLFCLSKKVLCDRVFSNNRSNNWDTSDLRRWLKNDFYNSTFSFNEQIFIERNISLLSYSEAQRISRLYIRLRLLLVA